jgi:circadian clock protein KaiC
MTNDTNVKVISTGNEEMDAILNGGFPVNSINVIMGEPGTGKTVFAEQLVFHHAKPDDRPILYLTTLSEPLSKLLTYLQRFSFYDENKIGTAVHYKDIGHELSNHGIGVLQKQINDAIHEIGPKIIVIDSFKTLHDLPESSRDMRKMLHELTSMIAAYETTVFLLGEYTDEQSKVLPEFAIADGIVQFLRKPLSSRDERFVRVLKMRGSSYKEGLHGFRITGDGLQIYPRLISPQFPKQYSLSDKRVSSGIKGLDPLIAGGFLESSTTLIAGSSGSGKTTAALQFIFEGVRNNEPGLFINFQENPTQLARTISNLHPDAKRLDKSGLHLMYMSPVELQIDSIIVTIFSLINKHGLKRVVIDAAGDLISASSDSMRSHNYLYALNQHFSVNGVTSVLTFEIPSGLTGTTLTEEGERFSCMSDSIILLNMDVSKEPKRSLTIVKQRSSQHSLGIHEMAIGPSGIVVGKPVNN